MVPQERCTSLHLSQLNSILKMQRKQVYHLNIIGYSLKNDIKEDNILKRENV